MITGLSAFLLVLLVGLLVGVTPLAAFIGGTLAACGVLFLQARAAPPHADMDREQS